MAKLKLLSKMPPSCQCAFSLRTSPAFCLFGAAPSLILRFTVALGCLFYVKSGVVVSLRASITVEVMKTPAKRALASCAVAALFAATASANAGAGGVASGAAAAAPVSAPRRRGGSHDGALGLPLGLENGCISDVSLSASRSLSCVVCLPPSCARATIACRLVALLLVLPFLRRRRPRLPLSSSPFSSP